VPLAAAASARFNSRKSAPPAGPPLAQARHAGRAPLRAGRRRSARFVRTTVCEPAERKPASAESKYRIPACASSRSHKSSRPCTRATRHGARAGLLPGRHRAGAATKFCTIRRSATGPDPPAWRQRAPPGSEAVFQPSDEDGRVQDQAGPSAASVRSRPADRETRGRPGAKSRRTCRGPRAGGVGCSTQFPPRSRAIRRKGSNRSTRAVSRAPVGRSVVDADDFVTLGALTPDALSASASSARRSTRHHDRESTARERPSLSAPASGDGDELVVVERPGPPGGERKRVLGLDVKPGAAEHSLDRIEVHELHVRRIGNEAASCVSDRHTARVGQQIQVAADELCRLRRPHVLEDVREEERIEPPRRRPGRGPQVFRVNAFRRARARSPPPCGVSTTMLVRADDRGCGRCRSPLEQRPTQVSQVRAVTDAARLAAASTAFSARSLRSA